MTRTLPLQSAIDEARRAKLRATPEERKAQAEAVELYLNIKREYQNKKYSYEAKPRENQDRK